MNDYSDRIYTYILSSIKDAEQAADITQDTFIALWDNRKKVDPAKVKAWLYKTAYHKMLNQIRKRKRETYLDLEANSSGLHYSSNYENQEIVEKAFNLLLPEQRSLISLNNIEGYSYQEIAGMLNIPERKVKARLFRARQKFKQLIEALLKETKV